MSSFQKLIESTNDQEFIDILNELNSRDLSLLPGSIDKSMNQKINQLQLSEFSHKAKACIKAGLLEWNDDIHASHDICQDIYSKTGSYWHGIMHRREPDYGNAKYWYYKFPGYPTFDDLRAFALNLDDAGNQEIISFKQSIELEWQAFDFIDLCSKAERSKDHELIKFCEAIQKEEIILLLIDSMTL